MKKLFSLFATHESRGRYVPIVSFMLFLLGSIWISLLSTVSLTTQELKPRGIFVNENSLLPGAAYCQLNQDDVDHPAKLQFQEEYSTETIKAGLFRARKAADRRETIAIVAMEKRGDDILEMLLKTFQRGDYLSKDLLFIVISQNQTLTNKNNSLRQFLEAYALNPLDDKIPRNGPIRGAIIVDIPYHNCGGYERNEPGITREAILVQGFNGQLPNMDLISAAQVTRMGPPFFTMTEHEKDDTNDISLAGIRFARDVIIGPNGWHAEFLRLGIDAMTIKATCTSNYTTKLYVSRRSYGQRVEEMVRALSNIGEKLNHSFYYYIMLRPEFFVSINEFLWAFALFISPLVLDALFISLAPNDDGFQETILAIKSLFVAIFFGAVIIPFIVIVSKRQEIGIIWLTLSICFLGWERYLLLSSPVINHGEKQQENWLYKKAANEMFLYLGLFGLGVIHFPLAMYTAIACLPTTCLASPAKTRFVDLKFVLGNFIFFLTSFPIFIENTLVALDVTNFENINNFVVFFLIIPNQFMNLSILWGPKI